MKTKAFFITILVLGVLFTSCEKEKFEVFPSGKITTANLSVTGISSIDVSSLFNVYVSFSETEESAIIEANDNLQSFIQFRQIGDRLVVGLEKNMRISGDPILNLHVKTSSLERVIAEGAVMVEFKNPLVNEQFEIELTGFSKIKGVVETESLIANIEGASTMELNGSSDNFQIDAEGACEMSGFNFITNKLDANLNGGCEISLTVQDKMNVVARGASKVYYKGDGVIENQNLKDASEIIKMD